MNSIEEKAKRYDEAIERAKKWYDANTNEGYRGIFEEIFPELAESEDERIRKRLLDLFKGHYSDEWYGLKVKDVISWLEKQGEQKATIEMKSAEESLGIDSETYSKIVDECIFGEQKHTDKVEQKFKVGDWFVSPNGVYWHIDTINNNRYEVSSTNGKCAEWQLDTKIYHLWTIQDAKDGDVLVTREKSQPFIFKKYDEDTDYVYAYCGICDLVKDNSFHTDDDQLWTCYSVAGDVYPATKEQCDTLMKVMADAGYIFDFEKKELKKIEKKLAWSEEDDKIIEEIINDIECARAINYHDSKEGYEFRENWLESLKDRVQPKQEWSKEDEGYYDAIIAKLEVTREDALLTDNEMDFLKSLEGRVLPKST